MNGVNSAGSESSVYEGSMFALEQERVASRRSAERLIHGSEDVWALAISGGGIRSATLGFGVMQAMGTISLPGALPAPDRPPASRSVLARFDYLSTVSGGGYIGAFFCSLFVPGRLRAQPFDPDKGDGPYAAAADDAYSTMATVPPGRLRSRDTLGNTGIGKCPTAWLRDNGRYLAPGGTGDYLYMAATAIRNWIAVHYVLGTLFLCAFSALALARSSLLAEPMLRRLDIGAYYSPLWVVLALVIALWVLPSGLAFWLSYPGQGHTDRDEPDPFGFPALCAAVLIVPLVAAGIYLLRALHRHASWVTDAASVRAMALAALATAAGISVGVIFYGIAASREPAISSLRVRLTTSTAHALGWSLVLALVAAAESLGVSVYKDLFNPHPLSGPVASGLLAFLVWGVRQLAKLFDERKVTNPSLGSGAVLGAISAVAGGLILLLAASIWEVLVSAVVWLGQKPTPDVTAISSWQVVTSSCLLLFSLWLARTVALFPGFLNLSALQPIYGARLTRAYLGASNGQRFKEGASREWRSAAQPHEGDQLSLAQYYDRNSRSPIHIINVTMNQTVDPADALIQRDRKGRPLAVLPTGFCVDGTFWKRDDCVPAEEKSLRRGKATQPLSVGQWIGTSGAAVSTGLGRATTFGTSLALGLSNIRLGVWWSSGKGEDQSRGLGHAFKELFRTQTFLLYELAGRFYGLHREWQYLSDGGHFENTAMYELLRRADGIRLIVACDNGCDPDYKFDDLANLIRLARIDFSLDIEIDSRIVEDPMLGKVFGNMDDFNPRRAASDKCAILLNVFPSGRQGTQREQSDSGQPLCRIVLIKPRLIANAPIDLAEYKRKHDDYPQQSTANQFFDEAQWESYRELGYRIGRRIFAPAQEGGLGAALWEYLGVYRAAVPGGAQPTVKVDVAPLDIPARRTQES